MDSASRSYVKNYRSTEKKHTTKCGQEIEHGYGAVGIDGRGWLQPLPEGEAAGRPSLEALEQDDADAHHH